MVRTLGLACHAGGVGGEGGGGGGGCGGGGGGGGSGVVCVADGAVGVGVGGGLRRGFHLAFRLPNSSIRNPRQSKVAEPQ